MQARGALAAGLLICLVAFLPRGSGGFFLPLVAALLLYDLSRYRGRMRGVRFFFDGATWLTPSGRRAQVAAAYCGGGLLAARLRCSGESWNLLVLRCQLSRERWRRLRLATAYCPPVGDNTVSTASGSKSG